MSGPLAGLRVVEIASIGPGPFAAMVLADLGATVVRVERPGSVRGVGGDPLLRGRAAVVAIDLKDPAGSAVAGRLVDGADVLIEGFRPGVAERLGIGPDICLGRNPALVYGRITGWGQAGPRAQEAGHDIDYIALAGALQPIGPRDAPPPPPLNLVADFGGGGMLLVVGILAALTERSRSGAGQVVDAAMVDGSALLMAMHHGLAAAGLWSDARGDNVLDGAAPFYRCYRTADERFMAVGALEPEFYAALLAGLGLDPTTLPAQYDRDGWEATTHRFAEVFATRTRDEWARHFSGSDACVAPVLTPLEATRDPHLIARETFLPVGGVLQPAPAPRFGRTPNTPATSGVDAAQALRAFGLSPAEAEALLQPL